MFPLPTDVGAVRELTSYLGHVFVVAENALLVFDVNNFYDLLNRVTLPRERLQGVSVSTASDGGAEVLITSNRGVYSLDLLDLTQKQMPKPQYNAADTNAVYHHAAACAGDIYWLEYNATSGNSELHSLKRSKVATYPGHVHPLLNLGKQHLLVVAADRLYLIDCAGGLVTSETLSHDRHSETVNMSCQPAADEARGTAYLVGSRSLWKVAASGGKLITQPLQLRSTGDERLAAARDNIFVARSDGFYILDLLGAIRWKADSIFIPEDTSDGFYPQVDGDYCLFSGLKGGGSVIRIYNVVNPGKNTRGIPVESAMACSPVLNVGHLIIAVDKGEGGKRELRVYRLKT